MFRVLNVPIGSIQSSGQNILRSVTSIVPTISQEDHFTVQNERILEYPRGSKEREEVEKTLNKISNTIEEIPIVIGDEEISTADVRYQIMPHSHKKRIAKFSYANTELIKKAIDVSRKTQLEWDEVPLNDRISIWSKAADLMAGKYRAELNASTMAGMSKTVIQADSDAAAESVDFLRFNAFYARELSRYRPLNPNPQVSSNSFRHRGLEGFVAAVSPFNFTALGCNLAFTPALMGCAVVWKPSDTAVLSNWTLFKVMREAGLPAGVVNFVPADGPVFGDFVTSCPHLAGVNFVGSAATFKRLWTQVGQNVDKYVNFPRLSGECGGKNYHFVHPSADPVSVVNATLRAAFEYSGQKCSACSRLYVPESLWSKIRDGLIEILKTLKVGDVQDFDSFTSAVIDQKAFDRIKNYIEYARNSPDLEIIFGGQCDDSDGYFVHPTIVRTKNPTDKLMTEEIFGPVLTVYVYEDNAIEETLNLIGGNTTTYALTGSVFAQDENFSRRCLTKLKYTAGNFYVNDKCTGAMVGQQPFGGSRMSGTNDKFGGPYNVLRWTSPQTVKETFAPLM